MAARHPGARVCQGPDPGGLDSLPAAEAALLLDHVRLRVRGEDYPGLRPQRGASRGRLYRPLPAAVQPALDAFEGEEYERVSRAGAAGGRCPGAGLDLPLPAPRWRASAARALVPPGL